MREKTAFFGIQSWSGFSEPVLTMTLLLLNGMVARYLCTNKENSFDEICEAWMESENQDMPVVAFVTVTQSYPLRFLTKRRRVLDLPSWCWSTRSRMSCVRRHGLTVTVNSWCPSGMSDISVPRLEQSPPCIRRTENCDF